MFDRQHHLARRAALLIAFATLTALAVPALAEDTNRSPVDALKSGKVSMNLRYRFENVHDGGFVDNGYASTLRTALSYTTAPWHGLTGKTEFQGVVNITAARKHNNKGAGAATNGVSDRPVVADPDQTDFNQAYLDWNGKKGTEVRFGRQEILLDNVRFVGNVGWRQFHQSFDGAVVTTRAIPRTKATYAFVYNQNRIFSDTQRMTSHLANAGVDLRQAGTLTANGYLIDYDMEALSGLSTLTYGLRWNGATTLQDRVTGLYDLELARQNDAGDNPNTVDAGYYRATLGGRYDVWTLKAGYEVLEGAPGDGAFTTPLATLHAWNGWADKFLKTPASGLEDVSVSLGAKISAWKFLAVYHDFSANNGGASYGSEIDFLAAWTAPWKQGLALKAASYSADDFSKDVTKIWAFSSWKF